jgi:tetratricopeptide (TPR) repeat protein
MLALCLLVTVSMSASPALVHYLDGNRLLASGDLAGAEICYLQALLAEPVHAGARANLGVLKERQGRLGEAEQHYRLALALMPGHAQLHLNLGIVLLKSKRFADGEELARRAVQLAPESVAAWNQLGVLLACVKREAESEQCYRHALALGAADAADAESARTRFNLAYLLLRQGRHAEGWPLLESRWQFDPLPRRFHCPRWEGEPLAGRSLVIGLEAGQGDMIHFCRYATLAKAQGAARIAVVRPFC